jgi:hypothetical protein
VQFDASATLPSLVEGADERQRHYSAALVDEYTATQGQYLPFIYYYTKLHGVPRLLEPDRPRRSRR